MKRLLTLLLAALVLSGCIRAVRTVASRLRSEVSAPTAASAGPVPPAVSAALTAIVKQGVPGVTAIAMKNGKDLYRIDVGDVGPGTVYPIASATKWLTAALVMTVVDEGKLKLDAPISDYLPEFKGDAGRITLRELLAQTSGGGSLKGLIDMRQSPRMTLAQSAAEIAQHKLEDPPGTVFKYGGPGFQIAGALVEQATGERWSDLFDERIAGPLGMAPVAWSHLVNRGVSPSQTRNPLLQAGAEMKADDYMKFLTMLAQGGVYDGHRILSARAVDEMETAQTIGKPMAWVPPGVTGAMQYGLGNWCAKWTTDGHCTLVMSPGAFGTLPWIDRPDGIYGIFFLRDRLPHVSEELHKAMEATIEANR